MPLSLIKPAPRVRRKTTEQFGRRQNDEISYGEAKSMTQRPENELDILQRCGMDDFAESFDFALGLKINENQRVFRAPILEPFDELIAFGLGQDEITDRKFTDVAILKRAVEVLRPGFDPGFADLNLGGGIVSWLDLDPDVIGPNVIAHETILLVRRAQ